MSIKDTPGLWSKIETRLENRKLAPFIKFIRCGGNEITLAKYNVQELMRDPNKFLVPIFKSAFSLTHHQIARTYTRNSLYSFEYDYTYIGGYNDMWKLRDFDLYQGTVTSGNTHECYMICKKEGYHYFGIQREYQCWCGNNYGTYGRRNGYDGCTNKKNVGILVNCVYRINEYSSSKNPKRYSAKRIRLTIFFVVLICLILYILHKRKKSKISFHSVPTDETL